jgi:hypothetical protein
MARQPWAVLAGLLLLLPGSARAAEPELAGNWKVTMLDAGEQPSPWLLRLDVKDGKWTGKVLSRGDVGGERVAESTVSDVKVTDDRILLTITVKGRPLTFEGKLPRDKSGTVRGSMYWITNQLFPALLEPTQLQSLEDTFEINKEIVAKGAGDLRFFVAAFELLAEAGKKKAKAEDVRGWADKAFRAADAHGPRWQRHVAEQEAHFLLKGGGFTDLALTYARRAERLLDPKASSAEQVSVLGTLVRALKEAGKADELKEVEARLDKIDVSLKPEKFAGRKGKSTRAVLVELFTGAQCPPCVGADLAFDALGKTYNPAEVVLLEYHEHIPGPDALTSKDTEARLEYYQRAIKGTPTMLFDGRPLQASGGSADEAPSLYEAYREVLDEQLLERPAGAKVTATAVRKGNKIDITAEASDVDKPDDPLRLRVALVEEEVRYAGSNQLRLHHHVVRAFPGGAEGVAIKGKTGKQAVTVDLDELRKELTKYLDETAKKVAEAGEAFPKAGRPMELKNLKIVAFVQNDKTKEVLQAVQADVRSGE